MIGEIVLGDAELRRALVACLAIALGSAPVGVFLTLRRMSLMGDALSHALLPGVAVAFVMAGSSMLAMMAGGLLSGLAVALGAGLLSRLTAQREDANLAALFVVALAAGVAIVSSAGQDEDLLHILFGSTFDLEPGSVVVLASIASVTLVALALLLRPLVMECFDPLFLRSVSRWSGPAHYAFLALVVLNLVGAFYAVGTLLALGLMILPAVAARFWARDLLAMIAVALVLAVAGTLAGLALAGFGVADPGPAVVLCLGAVFVVSFALGRHGSLLARRTSRVHLEA